MSENSPEAWAQRTGWNADLELLALEEQFVAEYAAGGAPRLAAYVRRYPQHAEALTAFVANYLSPFADVAGTASEATPGEMLRPISAGTRRALDAIFGERDEAARVAEERAGYLADGGGEGSD